MMGKSGQQHVQKSFWVTLRPLYLIYFLIILIRFTKSISHTSKGPIKYMLLVDYTCQHQSKPPLNKENSQPREEKRFFIPLFFHFFFTEILLPTCRRQHAWANESEKNILFLNPLAWPFSHFTLFLESGSTWEYDADVEKICEPHNSLVGPITCGALKMGRWHGFF